MFRLDIETMQVNGIPYEQWKKQAPKKKFEFQDDTWRVIKEFAGIYSIGKQWGKVSKLTWPKICSVYTSAGVTDVKIIRKGLHGLRKYKTKELWENMYVLAQPKKRVATVDIKKFAVGNRVLISTTGARFILCSITKITAATLFTTSGTFRATSIRAIKLAAPFTAS